MSKTNTLDLIKGLGSSIINEHLNQENLKISIDAIHQQFQKATDISGYDSKMEHLAAIPASKGKALGLNHAAQCLLDYHRTEKFVKAILIAIRNKREANPDKTVSIFYAGCGPYAPLFTLVAPHFKPEEVQFELLEINSSSVTAAQKLIEHLNLKAYLRNIHEADAITFQIEEPREFDILISETLDCMLFRECYVPILANLLPQFHEEITVIPQNVQIDLSFLTSSINEENNQEEKYGSIMNVREVLKDNALEQLLPSHVMNKKVPLAPYDMSRFERILIDTRVHVLNDIWLERGSSSLTIPFEIPLEQPFNFEFINFDYFIDPEIELKCGVE
ncbi:hypothetical protein LX97_01973 [Nonlabens dokdonensis]|uniref:Phytanoyl-CoA dioxygenase n=2 Tax=Nonlabens dokdonensis TaxID=328515 RepID=L7WD55_NONDD|nr:phytanoyl-CoA dioxygenase [Nonlabens dokdonensis]AGC77851.1 phytanoyl-CoA dioxygenase [Nonlabens dokdonensis DSW-6]PZX39619.1 hypothetical protein LX97_01973 [Nonlabens dokdonensis]